LGGREFAFSRHHLSEVCKFARPKKKEAQCDPQDKGAGKTGCALHPRSHVQK
jgi:hypothetical protein